MNKSHSIYSDLRVNGTKLLNREFILFNIARTPHLFISLIYKYRNSRVIIWDSGNPLAEEYIRACHILEREDYHHRRQWLDAYFNCYDYTHAGYVALLHTTQIVLNGICS